MSLNLKEFRGIEKDWSSYYERCEFYFVTNTIEDNNVKRAVFSSVVGDTTYQLIRWLLSPKKHTEVDFSDIIKTFICHYNPKNNAIVERFKFNTCMENKDNLRPTYIDLRYQKRRAAVTVIVVKSEGPNPNLLGRYGIAALKLKW